MLPPKFLDEALRGYATPTQWEYYEAYVTLGSVRAVARVAGKAKSTIQESLAIMMDKAVLDGYVKLPDPQPELKVSGVSTYVDKDGNESGWTLQRQRGLDPSDGEEEPEPGIVSKVATYTDSEGRITGQWKTVKRDDAAKAELFMQWIARAKEDIRILPPVAAKPSGWSRSDLLAVYPVGDHHVGMLAWALETAQKNGNYDLPIARERLTRATRQLIDMAPSCDVALIAFLGDFFHVDGYKNATPSSGHLLDMDVRFPKMYELGLDLILYVIQAALEKHQTVHVIFEKGNHDYSIAGATTIFLKHIFRDNPRVVIDDSPAWSHYFKFGKVLLGTNHGDNTKPAQQLPAMAADRPEDWGQTTYRMMMLGHVHHEVRREFPGGFVESFGVLPPLDAYAAKGGYRSMCQMHSLIFHKDGWLAQRNYATPAMWE